MSPLGPSDEQACGAREHDAGEFDRAVGSHPCDEEGHDAVCAVRLCDAAEDHAVVEQDDRGSEPEGQSEREGEDAHADVVREEVAAEEAVARDPRDLCVSVLLELFELSHPLRRGLAQVLCGEVDPGQVGIDGGGDPAEEDPTDHQSGSECQFGFASSNGFGQAVAHDAPPGRPGASPLLNRQDGVGATDQRFEVVQDGRIRCVSLCEGQITGGQSVESEHLLDLGPAA